jgi:basic membrane lipoprotein Med (substrate-binding protein (PBP1-ABC) superfamily)|tara:strand:+ start:160 stop:438 length:279 start_codon:yes stop_codon:yes gene_type:complete
MDRDYFQDALQTFNGGDWYGWKKNFKGLNRMSYENIEIVKEGATMPSEADVNTKIAELKQQETDSQNNKASAKKKLQDLGLTVDEIKEAFGI